MILTRARSKVPPEKPCAAGESRLKRFQAVEDDDDNFDSVSVGFAPRPPRPPRRNPGVSAEMRDNMITLAVGWVVIDFFVILISDTEFS